MILLRYSRKYCESYLSNVTRYFVTEQHCIPVNYMGNVYLRLGKLGIKGNGHAGTYTISRNIAISKLIPGLSHLCHCGSRARSDDIRKVIVGDVVN
jgi:hypothetical protein